MNRAGPPHRHGPAQRPQLAPLRCGRRDCRLDKCEREKTRAKQRKAGNGHSEETVRSKFFAHGTPTVLEKPGHQSSQASLRLCANRTTAALHSQKYFDRIGKLESD